MTDKNAAKANWLIAGACLVAMIWLAAIGYKDKSVHLSRRHKSTKMVKSFTRTMPMMTH